MDMTIRWEMIKTYSGIIRAKQSKAKQVCETAVIIALYNQGQYLKDAVESVYKNSIHPQEVIIIDDCSTDDSAVKAFDIVAEYAAKLPSIKLTRNEVNRGLAGARNVAIMGARSPWLVCLDADDKLELNYFKSMVDLQKLSGYDILYTDAILFGAVNGRVQWPQFDPLILRTRNICFASSLFSREVYDKCGGYDEDFKHGFEDYALWLKALQNGFKFAKNETTGLYYRRHAESMSGVNVFGKYKRENYELLKAKFGNFYLGRG